GRQRKIDHIVSRATRNVVGNPGLAQETFERLRDKNGVLCFSEDPKGLLLWAHYAKGHTGICYQFDVTRCPGFLMLAHRVTYGEKFPVLAWPSGRESIVKSVILHKGIDWASEKEVRYIS